MGVFDKMLRSDESIFKNDVVLEYDFIPKLMPFRDNEQFAIAKSIRPLFMSRNGGNVIVTGKPGIGKTLALKKVMEDLEEHMDEAEDEIIPLYVNCWKKNSSYKVILEICNLLDYKFTHNKKTDELFDVAKKMLNKHCSVLVFDEIDKADDTDFLYMFLEELYKKSIILITNDTNWISSIDHRIKSRLLPEIITFRPYSLDETNKIIRDRISMAFYDGVFNQDAIPLVAQKAYELKDIRTGLFILKKAGEIAESNSSREITVKDVEKAIEGLDEFSKKTTAELEPDEKYVLEIVKQNSGKKIGDLYEIYKQKSKGTYKTFQRRIQKLSDSGYISVRKTQGGSEGNTTFVDYSSIKKLTEF